MWVKKDQDVYIIHNACNPRNITEKKKKIKTSTTPKKLEKLPNITIKNLLLPQHLNT